MTNIEIFTEKLLESIENKNVQESIVHIQEFKEFIKSDAEYVVWITTPGNLNKLQKSITENYGVPQKAMMIKARPGSSRGLRASFFLQAIENGLKRVV